MRTPSLYTIMIFGHLNLLSFMRLLYGILRDVNTIAQVFKDMAKWEDQRVWQYRQIVKREIVVI